MRKYHKSVWIGGVILLVLLAGCEGQSGKTNDTVGEAIEDVSKSTEENIAGVFQSFGEKVGEVVGEATSALGEGVQNTSLELGKELRKEGVSKELSATQEVLAISELQIDHAVGNIEVKATAGDKIIVDAVIWAGNNASEKAKIQKIFDQAEVSVTVSGDQLKINTHPKGKPELNLWDWAQGKYGLSKFIIDYTVQVPSNVDRFNIINNVGNINVYDLKGTYLLHNDVGLTTIEEAQIIGESSVVSETGSVQLGVAQMDGSSSLKVEVAVGSIDVTLANSVQCNLTAESDVGHIKGVSKGTNEINGGGPLLSLTSNIGSINVN